MDFGAHQLNPGDDYPDFIIPLARAVAAGDVERGVALCGSGVGASIAANKVPGVHPGLIHDVFSAHQGVEDDDMNVICLGGKVIGSALARELIETFLAAHFSGAGATSAAWPRCRRWRTRKLDHERSIRGVSIASRETTTPDVAEGRTMKTAIRATEKLHEMGQSLWLDNITRGLLSSGTLRRYIQEFSVTGLTSNPTIFDHAIKNSHDYDDAIRRKLKEGKSGEALFFELGLEDLGQAADLFRPIHDETNGVDGWVSLEVSPLLAHDTAGTLAAAKDLHARAARPNLFIKIPGTREGLPAIEEAIFAGVPVNVTLLFSREQYAAAAEAYLRGIERRIAAGLKPDVGSVASMFISRWDVAVMGKVPEDLRNQLGIAVARRTYEAYRSLLDSPRWQRILNAGARPQRLLWASTGTKDPYASDLLYIEALAAPFTVNTMPEGTLNALAEHGEIGRILPAHGGDCEEVLTRFARAGIDIDALAAQLQDEGARSFVKSWKELLDCIASRSEALK